MIDWFVNFMDEAFDIIEGVFEKLKPILVIHGWIVVIFSSIIFFTVTSPIWFPVWVIRKFKGIRKGRG